MNTFWGCETESMTALSAVVDDRATRLGALIDAAAAGARAVAWFGPDAEDHRLRTEELVETARRLIETLRRLGELLDEEAEQQEICSRPEGGEGPAGDALPVRAAPPDGDGPGRDPSPPDAAGGPTAPFLSRPPGAGGGFRLPDGLPRLRGRWELGPLIGGPLMEPDPWRPPRARGPLPEGEDFDIDPGTLAGAERHRRTALSYVPVLGTLQSAMGLHQSIGDVHDAVEQGLEESGLGALTPLVSASRVPHAVAGAALGEDSVLGQTTSAIDRGLANAAHTSQEVLSEVVEGDAAGAARAAERGLFRQAGVVADIVTATPVPAVASAASDVIGLGADVTEVVSPEAADTLRDAAATTREVGTSWEEDHARLTDPERYYDLRRTYAPMPWDPTE